MVEVEESLEKSRLGTVARSSKCKCGSNNARLFTDSFDYIAIAMISHKKLVM